MEKKLLLAFVCFCFWCGSGYSAVLTTDVETVGESEIETGTGTKTDTGSDTGTGTGSGTGTGTDTNGSGGSTGISENGSLLLNVVIYPNPTNGDLYISPSLSAQLKNLKLFSSTGALLFESNDKILKIDLRSYPTGVYYIQMTTVNSEKYLNKIVKTTD